MSQHPEVAKLVSCNARWAEEARASDSEYFAKQVVPSQKPTYLWIGCSDSRVVEALITGYGPGHIFTQRNIANQFHLDDFNAQSVLAYAIDVLEVPHIYVVGHTHCGGVEACFNAANRDGFDPSAKPVVTLPSYPAQAPINRWLEPLTLLSYDTQAKDIPSLTETSVKQQITNLCKSETVQGAWARRQSLTLSGFIYDIAAGILRPVALENGSTTVTSA
ncbi:hypothetical protein ONZ45_g6990 [Pleurotus djamor]|nr:hypothetical protein ONZ45_g6990 [Pleurotus djamor]